MAYEINKRIFGSPIPKKVREKLELRQNLSKQIIINESIGGGDSTYKSNFSGDQDLSSRTPFARLWTAVQLLEYNIISTEPTPISTEIYSLGNNVYNNLPVKPNDSIDIQRKQYSSRVSTAMSKEALPFELESDKNTFFDAPAGIKSITSQTEGMGASKKTQVNFRVFNYADYQNIYLRYFLKPGAQVFIDFGWDVSSLYDPKKLVEKPDEIAENLYGPNGYVTQANGDLEILYGNVVNYTSKAQDDGSIDISLEIISSGTALVSKNMSHGDAAKIRRKISFGLDLSVCKYLKEIGYISNLTIDGSVETNYEKSKLLSKKLGEHGLSGGALSDKSQAYAESGFSENDSTGLDYKNYPSTESNKTGVWFRGNSRGESTEGSAWISLGLFEDIILNKEFGFADGNFDNVLQDKNSIRFDSSNHYVRWNENLYKYQGNMSDISDMSYVYPRNWDKSYNTILDKVPDYDETEKKSLLKQRRIEAFEVTENVELTQEQLDEAVIQYEYNVLTGKKYHTIPNDFDLSINNFKRRPYRTKGKPYCISIVNPDKQNTSTDFPLGTAYGTDGLDYSYSPVLDGNFMPVKDFKGCATHGDYSINGGYDFFVQSADYEGPEEVGLDGQPGLGYNDLDKPIAHDDLPYFIPSRDDPSNTGVPFTLLKNGAGLKKGQEVFIGNGGYYENVVESADVRDLSNTEFDMSVERLPIRELFISVPVIKKAFLNNNNIVDALQEIFSQIKEDSGDIINLQLSANDYSGTKMSILDANYVESEMGLRGDADYFMFNINNDSTLVKSFDISYQVPSDDYGSYVAIHAMAGEEMNSTNEMLDFILSEKILYSAQDSQYSTRYLPYIGNYQAKVIKSYSQADVVEASDTKDATSVDSSQKDKTDEYYKKLVGGLQEGDGYNLYNTKINVNFQNLKEPPKDGETEPTPQAVDQKVAMLENLTDEEIYTEDQDEYYLQKAKNQFFKESSSTPLPFEVSLNLYGISSLVVGDTFNISYLPKAYRDNVFFQITGITHNVENNGWYTEITSKMRQKSKSLIQNLEFMSKNVAKVSKNLSTATSNSSKILVSPKKALILNKDVIRNKKVQELGVENFKELQFVNTRTFSEATSIETDKIMRFRWGGEKKYFNLVSIVASFNAGVGRSYPSMSKIKEDWRTILKTTQKIKQTGYGASFFFSGPQDEDSVRKLPKEFYRFNENFGNYIIDSLLVSKYENQLGDELSKYILNTIAERPGNIHNYYFTVHTTIELNEGSSYYLYTTPGLGQLIMFPIQSPVKETHALIPKLFPAVGNPIRGPVGAAERNVQTTNDFYKAYQATESKADFLKEQ